MLGVLRTCRDRATLACRRRPKQERPAGVGKTRLGLRLAARVGHHYRDGVWFVDLASVADPAMLTHVVARALEVHEEPGQSPLQRLVHRLRDAHLLLVLDTCEHLRDACAELAVGLIPACPYVRLLAISREPLETDGDTIWRVPPLAMPTAQAIDHPTVAASDAVKLFVARVRARDARFSVTVANSADIAAICRHVDGLPLALELVAARAGSTAVLGRLRLDLAQQVTARCPDRQRQQLLRMTLDWTHRQLSASQRVVFRRLGVFAGSWTLASACTVCADDRLSPAEVATAIDRLVAGSLVMVETPPMETQYRLLDTVRSYALDQLQASGEAEAFHRRQLMHMVALAEREPPETLNAAHAALLERELENLRAALRWALANREATDTLRLATAACSLWYFRGYYAEGCAWLERGLALAGADNTLTRARAAAWLGQLLQIRGDYAAAEHWITDALQRHQAFGDALGSALSVAMLGQLLLMRGELRRARRMCADAAQRLNALNHPLHVASRLQSAIIAIELGNLERARAIVDQCEAHGLESHASLAGWLRFLKGRIAEARGDLDRAHTLLAEALQLSRAAPEQLAIVAGLLELGYVQVEHGWNAQAVQSFAEAVELAHRSGDRIQLARALEGLARSTASAQPAAAIRLAGAAGHLRSVMGASAWPSDRRRLAAWRPTARRELTPGQYRAAWQAGQASDIDETVALAGRLTTDQAPSSRADRLTARERQVIALLARALTTRQIAAELSISPATARTHIEHILAKLGLHTRAQVIVWATQQPTAATPPPR